VYQIGLELDHAGHVGPPSRKTGGGTCCLAARWRLLFAENPLGGMARPGDRGLVDSELPLRRMPVWSQTVLLLVGSNIFMTFAWYAHLKNLSGKPWWVAVLASWSIALFEYMLQVPANRIGYRRFNLAQLKILQEVITLSVFAPFAVIYMGQTLRWNYLAAFVCLLGAVYFAFR
jgi:uncharacterized protein (DUF486 family)